MESDSTTSKRSLNENAVRLYRYLWDAATRRALLDWLRVMISPKGIWAFAPGILGILFVYWANASGHLKLVNKGYNETLALWLMSLTTLVFIIRWWFYRLEIDLLLLVLAINFLCREIHFVGTDEAVFTVFGILVFWALCWKDRLLNNIKDAKVFQAALTGTAFCYFLAFIIQKRVFRVTRLPLLPNEENMHIPLEEVLENVSHLFFLAVGLIAFFSLSRRRSSASKWMTVPSNTAR